MSEDYEYDDTPCPKCGAEPTHWRRCTEIDCDDGFIDLYDEDPINEDPGTFRTCPECQGTGIHHWCPKCGHDFTRKQNANLHRTKMAGDNERITP